MDCYWGHESIVPCEGGGRPAPSCSVQADTPQENSMLYTIAVILLIGPEFHLIRISKPLSTRARSAIREAIRIRFTGESGQCPGTYGNNT